MLEDLHYWYSKRKWWLKTALILVIFLTISGFSALFLNKTSNIRENIDIVNDERLWNNFRVIADFENSSNMMDWKAMVPVWRTDSTLVLGSDRDTVREAFQVFADSISDGWPMGLLANVLKSDDQDLLQVSGKDTLRMSMSYELLFNDSVDSMYSSNSKLPVPSKNQYFKAFQNKGDSVALMNYTLNLKRILSYKDPVLRNQLISNQIYQIPTLVKLDTVYSLKIEKWAETDSLVITLNSKTAPSLK